MTQSPTAHNLSLITFEAGYTNVGDTSDRLMSRFFRSEVNIAYIPLRHKILALGHRVGLDPHHENFALGIPARKICITRETSNLRYPKRKTPMEYRLRWVSNVKFSHWPCTFHVVCAHFICVGYPNALVTLTLP